MTFKILSLLAVITALFIPFSAMGADGGELALTASRVIELAASSAPGVRLAATNVAQEEAKLAGAQVRTLQNPKLEAALGPRSGSEAGVDADVAVEVPWEFGRREKRVALARAGIEREKHAAQDVKRQVIAAALSAYYGVLQARERLAIVQERNALAGELLRVATERYQSGDGPKFDVNLAQGEVVRAKSEAASAKAQLATAYGALAQALGLPSAEGLKAAGDLRDRGLFDRLRSGESAGDRPDLMAYRADVEASDAAVSLAQVEGKPDWAFRLGYRREGRDNIAMAGVSVTLPVVNLNQGAIGEARARSERARIVAQARKASIAAETETARLTYDAAVEALRRLESEGLPLQRETEAMATESYRSGKINLATLLQVRRDALETRKEYLQRLLEAAEAGVKLASAVGIFTAGK